MRRQNRLSCSLTWSWPASAFSATLLGEREIYFSDLLGEGEGSLARRVCAFDLVLFTTVSWTVLLAVLFFILYSNASVFWIELVGRQFGVLLSVSVYLCTCGPTLVWSSKLTSFDTEPKIFFSLGWRQLLSFLLFRSVVPRGAAQISECLLECLWGHYVGEFDNDWSLEKRWS